MLTKNMFTVNYNICLVGILLSFRFELGFAKFSTADWKPATGTWYGDPEGNGSNGGACGYGPLVDVRPFKKRVTAVSPVLFQDGKGCGACYKVKCLDKKICSKRAVTVIVADSCPGCSGTHFDLSGAAFGRLAIAGKAGELRNQGKFPITYRRTPCKYPGKKIEFRVKEGSSAHWLSVQVVYQAGDGDIGAIHIKQAGSSEWMPMEHLSGTYWKIDGKGPIKGPYSIKLTTLRSGTTLEAKDVIPDSMQPGVSYTFETNFLAQLAR